jgi:uncharacterized protein (DUF305 family)
MRIIFGVPLVLGACVLATACSSKSPLPGDSHTAASSTAADSGMAMSPATGMSGMQHMSGMSGDPDHDFLRMMSDHHKGMIAMARLAIDSRENLSVKPDARELDKKQNAEIAKMTAILDRQYKDAYTPKVLPDNQQMVDELKGKSGKDFSRAFLSTVIMHHQEAIKMIDAYLPTAKNPEVKSMAEKMKADQTKEIAAFQKELTAL